MTPADIETMDAMMYNLVKYYYPFAAALYLLIASAHFKKRYANFNWLIVPKQLTFASVFSIEGDLESETFRAHCTNRIYRLTALYDPALGAYTQGEEAVVRRLKI